MYDAIYYFKKTGMTQDRVILWGIDSEDIWGHINDSIDCIIIRYTCTKKIAMRFYNV